MGFINLNTLKHRLSTVEVWYIDVPHTVLMQALPHIELAGL